MNVKRRDGGGVDLSTSVALELGGNDRHAVLSSDVNCQCIYLHIPKGSQWNARILTISTSYIELCVHLCCFLKPHPFILSTFVGNIIKISVR